MEPIDPLQELAKAGDMLSASLARAAASADGRMTPEVAEKLGQIAADLQGIKSGGFGELLARAQKKPKKFALETAITVPVDDKEFLTEFWSQHHMRPEPLDALIQSLLHDVESKSQPPPNNDREIWQDWED
ncbi:hypothetical protein AYO40_05145 [Planctomycetaceae bacterium SCGC AG-212-D15]|nr:hypothetical protein AYO40_05145 [Planctomycetaceae bacterium SCGC AG-212-D15]